MKQSLNELVNRAIETAAKVLQACPCEVDGRALSEHCKWCGAEPWTGCRWRDPECQQERKP